MAENLLNHRRIFDGGPSTGLRIGDDLQLAATVGAVFHVKVEDPFQQSRPAYAAGARFALASWLEVSAARSGGAEHRRSGR